MSVSSTTSPQPPGLRPIPILGAKANLPRFFGDPIGCLFKIYRECGLIGTITEGDSSLICVLGAEYNQQILADSKLFHNYTQAPFKVPEDSAVARIGTASIAINDDVHRRRRRMMMPAFTKSRIDDYRDDIVRITNQHLASWQENCTVDLADEMNEMALSIAMYCFFGLDIGEEARHLGHQAMQFVKYLTDIGVILFPYDLPGTPFRKFMKIGSQIESRLLELIHQRRAMKEVRKDVLSMLIDAHDEDQSQLTDKELLGEANVLFLAGHENTSYALVWILFLLSQYPDVCADLVNELDSVLHGDAPTVEQLDKLPLLDSVVKESMRLLPSVPFFFLREATSDFRVGPYDFPKKAHIIISSIVTHRISEIYKDAYDFKPERWQTIKPSAFEYMPFGAGPHMCIGVGFANLELRIVVAMIIQRFRLTVVDNADISCLVRGVTMGTKTGMPIVINKQDRQFKQPGRVRGDIGNIMKLPNPG